MLAGEGNSQEIDPLPAAVAPLAVIWQAKGGAGRAIALEGTVLDPRSRRRLLAKATAGGKPRAFHRSS
jgi:hypothetical protein